MNFSHNRIDTGASLLQLCVVAAIVKYAKAPRVVLPGALYLIVASYLALFCVTVTRSLRRGQPEDVQPQTAWLLRRKAYILVVSAWQLAIVGLLVIWACAHPQPEAFTVSYVCATVFIVLSYKMVAVADNPEQANGAMPLSCFGRPRSRKGLFLLFAFWPIGVLAFADVIIFFNWKWCPVPFQPPRLCLLLVALSGMMEAVLQFYRYGYKAAAPTDGLRKVQVLTFAILGLTGVLYLALAYSMYVYVLSSVTVSCIAATFSWSCRAMPPGFLANNTRTPT